MLCFEFTACASVSVLDLSPARPVVYASPDCLQLVCVKPVISLPIYTPEFPLPHEIQGLNPSFLCLVSTVFLSYFLVLIDATDCVYDY